MRSHHQLASLALRLALASSAITAIPGCFDPSKDFPAAMQSLTLPERSMAWKLSGASDASAVELRSQLAASATSDRADLVRRGEIVSGMSCADVLRAWGQPDRTGRPWLLVPEPVETEFWWYHGGWWLPDLEVAFNRGELSGVKYRNTARSVDVLRGEVGWVRKWSTTDAFKAQY